MNRYAKTLTAFALMLAATLAVAQVPAPARNPAVAASSLAPVPAPVATAN